MHMVYVSCCKYLYTTKMNRVEVLNRILDSSSSSSDSETEDIQLRKRKVYRKQRHWLVDCDDWEFFQRFRLYKNTVIYLLEQIEHLIKHPTKRSGCIQPIDQLLLALRFYSTGSLLISAGDFVGVSKSSARRIVKAVSKAIVTLRPDYIDMYSNVNGMQKSAETFYEIARFPRCIGAIDCTLIKIQSPGGDDPEIYRCRKGYFALNVLSVADSQLRFWNIVVRWPGSAHDQTVFNNSMLKQRFEAGQYGPYMLVGDTGYHLEPYLMTKLQNVTTEAGNLYNESIIRTRNVIERQYGVWKRRFQVLNSGIRLNVSNAMCVIVTTAILHNIAIAMNDLFPDNLDCSSPEENEAIVEGNIAENARNVRRLLIDQHFARL